LKQQFSTVNNCFVVFTDIHYIFFASFAGNPTVFGIFHLLRFKSLLQSVCAKSAKVVRHSLA